MDELARLDAIPPPPAAVEHLMHWWSDLQAGRRYGMGGPEPIGYADIEAWSRLTGAQPRPAEVRVLMQIDREWLGAENKRRAIKQQSKS